MAPNKKHKKRTLTDHSKRPTTIYILSCKDAENFGLYVGHTVNMRVRKRMHQGNTHKPHYAHYNFELYKSIREMGGWDNFEMISIATQQCATYAEVRALEQSWIDRLQPNLNQISAIKRGVPTPDPVPEPTPQENNQENAKMRIIWS
jgi:predicted GIY-YIG superfamily endonuclease